MIVVHLFRSGEMSGQSGQHDRVRALADDLYGTHGRPDDHAHPLPVAREAQDVEHLSRVESRMVSRGDDRRDSGCGYFGG